MSFLQYSSKSHYYVQISGSLIYFHAHSQTALDLLSVLCQHSKFSLKKEWPKLYKQLSQKRVLLTVVGRHNVGKSTLLNALMSQEYVYHDYNRKNLHV